MVNELFNNKTLNDAADAIINEKIKRANIKNVIGSILVAGIVDLFTIPLGPTFDTLSLIGWACLVLTAAFSLTYLLLFNCFGSDVVNEAKKRGKYLVKFCNGSSLQDDNFITDPRFQSYSWNIHNEDKY